ncbi:MAG: Fic family protein [Pseudomonadota bacterium]
MDPFKNLQITPALLRSIARIDEFKGRWSALGKLAPERLSALRRVATIESVGSSTRIEGVKLTDDEIEKLLGGVEIRSFRTRDEQEVAGYSDLMSLIFDSHDGMTLTENMIKQLHGVLLRHSHKDQRHRGHYKTLTNSVEAFDSDGRSLGVIFATASPFDTPHLIRELVEWTAAALDENRHHPLLVIAVFVVRFLAIHPFQDGNGRLSRALTTLLLLRAGYAYVPFSSLERVVEDSKDTYCLALRHAQATLDRDESQLAEWIAFFIACLQRQVEVLSTKLERERVMGALPPLSEQLLGYVREHGRLTVRDAATLTGASRNTIKYHLQQLVRSQVLARRGQGRGTWYDKA